MKRFFTSTALLFAAVVASAEVSVSISLLGSSFLHLLPTNFSVSATIQSDNYTSYDISYGGSVQLKSTVYDSDYLWAQHRRLCSNLSYSLNYNAGVETACANLINALIDSRDTPCTVDDLSFTRTDYSDMNCAVAHIRRYASYIGYVALYFDDYGEEIFMVRDLVQGTSISETYQLQHILSFDTYVEPAKYNSTVVTHVTPVFSTKKTTTKFTVNTKARAKSEKKWTPSTSKSSSVKQSTPAKTNNDNKSNNNNKSNSVYEKRTSTEGVSSSSTSRSSTRTTSSSSTRQSTTSSSSSSKSSGSTTSGSSSSKSTGSSSSASSSGRTSSSSGSSSSRTSR